MKKVKPKIETDFARALRWKRLQSKTLLEDIMMYTQLTIFVLLVIGAGYVTLNLIDIILKVWK